MVVSLVAYFVWPTLYITALLHVAAMLELQWRGKSDVIE